MKPLTLTVNTPSRRYPIHIGRGLLTELAALTGIQARHAVIVTNDTLAPLYLERVRDAMGEKAAAVVLPDGERYKTMETCTELLDQLLAEKRGRDTVLVALGGGVIGDLTGFTAAVYQRGIDFVQIPTTLLAQVDSSVGGKTAVNRPLGKNMVGAFHQPVAVISDLDTLDTLPHRELLAGLAEVIKYGLLGDADFFDWIDTHLDALLARDAAALTEAIRRSCEHKARIVAADERESGVRALLNLGHTFGHAIEAHLQYRDWLHGEAVAAGMLMAADMSCREGALTATQRDRVARLLQRAGLPITLPENLSAERMAEFMRGDKKNKDGNIRLILLDRIGQARLRDDYDPALLEATLQHFCRT
ncbi:MAG: 3-dehydroquinate synthase [Oceanococcaceae bacterium]